MEQREPEGGKVSKKNITSDGRKMRKGEVEVKQPPKLLRRQKMTLTGEQELVHRKMQDAIGVPYTGRKSVFVLPDPLTDDEPPRLQDGVKLWNPRWTAEMNHPENRSFVNHIVKVLVDDENGRSDEQVGLTAPLQFN